MCGRGRSCAGEQRPTRPSLRHERSMPAVHVPEGHRSQRASAQTRRGTLGASPAAGGTEIQRRRRSRKRKANTGRRGGCCGNGRSLRPPTYLSANDAGGRAQRRHTTHTRRIPRHTDRGGSARPARGSTAAAQPAFRWWGAHNDVEEAPRDTSATWSATRGREAYPADEDRAWSRNATTKAAGWLPEGSGFMVGDEPCAATMSPADGYQIDLLLIVNRSGPR